MSRPRPTIVASRKPDRHGRVVVWRDYSEVIKSVRRRKRIAEGRKSGEDRCLYDSEIDAKGRTIYSCHRPSLPGRMLCHKHAGVKARERRRKAKGKAARKARRVNR